MFELDGSGNVITEFVHGPGIDEPIAMIRNNQTYYYHADGLGSIVAITNATGAVVQRYEYDSFGNITYQQDPNFLQPYTYTGREYDEESGLYYYRARYYDAKVGRFINKDPIGFMGGDVNLYSYAANNPLLFTDPFGQNIYGNWCGPGGSGPVKDGIDQCCYNHDMCYKTGSANWKDNFLGTNDPKKQQCMDDCDKKLCECLKNYQPKNRNEVKGRELINIWFKCE